MFCKQSNLFFYNTLIIKEFSEGEPIDSSVDAWHYVHLK